MASSNNSSSLYFTIQERIFFYSRKNIVDCDVERYADRIRMIFERYLIFPDLFNVIPHLGYYITIEYDLIQWSMNYDSIVKANWKWEDYNKKLVLTWMAKGTK